MGFRFLLLHHIVSLTLQSMKILFLRVFVYRGTMAVPLLPAVVLISRSFESQADSASASAFNRARIGTP